MLVSPGTPHPGMPQVVLKKTEEVIAESDVVLFMVDARQGVTEADRHYARSGVTRTRGQIDRIPLFCPSHFCMVLAPRGAFQQEL